MRLVVRKDARELTLLDGDRMVLRARVALGRAPTGGKRAEGDGRTPEGSYRICLVKEQGKYGKSLGLSYPSVEDARRALTEGRIDRGTYEAIEQAQREGRRPPWGTPLGGEIYLHEGDITRDWTQGCIALAPEDMAALFALRERIAVVTILP